MGVSTYKSWDDPPSRCCCFGTNFGCAPQFCRDFFVEAPRFQSAHQPRWCFQVFSAEADQNRLHEEVQQQAMKMSSVALVVWSNKRPGQTSPAVIRLCHKTLCSWRRGRPFNGIETSYGRTKKKSADRLQTRVVAYIPCCWAHLLHRHRDAERGFPGKISSEWNGIGFQCLVDRQDFHQAWCWCDWPTHSGATVQ